MHPAALPAAEAHARLENDQTKTSTFHHVKYIPREERTQSLSVPLGFPHTPRRSVLSPGNVKDLGDHRSNLLSLEMNSPKLREVKCLYWGHAGHMWQSQDVSPRFLLVPLHPDTKRTQRTQKKKDSNRPLWRVLDIWLSRRVYIK